MVPWLPNLARILNLLIHYAKGTMLFITSFAYKSTICVFWGVPLFLSLTVLFTIAHIFYLVFELDVPFFFILHPYFFLSSALLLLLLDYHDFCSPFHVIGSSYTMNHSSYFLSPILICSLLISFPSTTLMFLFILFLLWVWFSVVGLPLIGFGFLWSSAPTARVWSCFGLPFHWPAGRPTLTGGPWH